MLGIRIWRLDGKAASLQREDEEADPRGRVLQAHFCVTCMCPKRTEAQKDDQVLLYWAGSKRQGGPVAAWCVDAMVDTTLDILVSQRQLPNAN